MQVSVMGTNGMKYTRNALSKNVLNLAEWFGYNEILYREPLVLDHLQFKFKLGPEAYLCLILEKDKNENLALCLSRNSNFPSRWARVLSGGAFTKIEYLPDINLGGGWYQAHLQFEGNQIKLGIGKNVSLNMPSIDDSSTTREPKMFGFRNGFNPVYIDDVRGVSVDGKKIFDNFRQSWKSTEVLVMLLLSLIVLVILTVFAYRLAENYFKTRMFYILLVELLFLFFGLVYYAVDFCWWSNKYQLEGTKPPGAMASGFVDLVERARISLFNIEMIPFEQESWEFKKYFEKYFMAAKRDQYGFGVKVVMFSERNSKGYELLSDEEILRYQEKKGEDFRVAFVGTSQTAGAGAELIEDTFVNRFYKHLKNSLPSHIQHTLEVWNFAIAGSDSTQLIKRYENSLKVIKPDFLFINLSNNDLDTHELMKNIAKLDAIARECGAKIFFVLEAHTYEENRPMKNLRHSFITHYSQQNHIPVFDLHGYLGSTDIRNSGFLWWDYLHLTSWGQEQTAKWLFEHSWPFINEKKM